MVNAFGLIRVCFTDGSNQLTELVLKSLQKLPVCQIKIHHYMIVAIRYTLCMAEAIHGENFHSSECHNGEKRFFPVRQYNRTDQFIFINGTIHGENFHSSECHNGEKRFFPVRQYNRTDQFIFINGTI